MDDKEIEGSEAQGIMYGRGGGISLGDNVPC